MTEYKECIEFIQNQYKVLERIAEVLGITVNEYLHDALFDAIFADLNNHHELGLEFCKMLKRKFRPLAKEEENKENEKEGSDQQQQ